MRLKLVACTVLLSTLGLASAMGQVALQHLSTFNRGLGSGAAEIVAFDPATRRAFVCNATSATVDIVDLSAPAAPALVKSVAVATWGAVANSVDVAGGVVAVAVEPADRQQPGQVVLLATDGTFLNAVPAGPVPDMLTFTPDGTRIVVANEGEPSGDYTTDPEGSVTIIDLSGGAAAAIAATVGFADFNVGGPRAGELPAGVRVFGPGATVAEDLEPEYVAVSSDGATAWVTLQENNAVAVVDVAAAQVVRIVALGTKDYSLPGNELDPSDKDGGIHLRTWPVQGLFLPDAIATFRAGGGTYVITANEGDARDYAAFSEEKRIKDVTLDPGAFPDAADLRKDAALGRLKITRTLGDTDGDGDYDELYAFNSRSFAIWDGATGARVFDSGNDFERITAGLTPTLFNSEGTAATFDGRSDDKGPEPEGVVVGTVAGRLYAFIALERASGIMVYDVTDPHAPFFVHYQPAAPGDVAPEGLDFVPAAASPTGEPLLLVANEVSGSMTTYQVAVAAPVERSCQWVDLAARVSGINGSDWRTDVTMRNTAEAATRVELILHTPDGVRPAWSVVSPGAQGVFENVVELLGYEGKGVLEMCSDQRLIAGCRLYSPLGSGTVGQEIPVYAAGAGLNAGESAWLVGLRQETSKWRTNISVSNTGAQPAKVKVTLYRTDGALLGAFDLTVAGLAVVQEVEPFRRRVGQPDLGWGFARVSVDEGAGILASASMVDSRTNDPTTVRMSR
jgi:DNA-binding beta-propeller fold protein YncE